MKRINIITLGCYKNTVDSEKFMGNLSEDDFIILHESGESANYVIINTCGFINDAKEESIETILQYAGMKTRGEIEKLVVMGCLSQRYKNELKEEIPEVDAWFGVDDNNDLLGYINGSVSLGDDNARVLTTPGHYAYLKIAEGCDRTCSFCAIPLIRGRYRSRPIESLVKEARTLARKGVKELILIAQDISYYGTDLDKKDMLAGLLDELVKIEGIDWIRLHYAYPLNFPGGVIRQIAGQEKICRYIDIPLQHINSNILKSMRRGVDKNKTIDLIERLRENVPGIAIRTTLMVGYPGETEKNFNELLEFVRNTRFDRMGVFTYSPEEDTPAWKIKDTVPSKVKEQRKDTLMTEQQKISLQLNQQKIGNTYKVIIDRFEGNYAIGRTEFDSPEVDNEVIIPVANGNYKPGMFCNIKVDGASEYELYGSPV